MGLIWYEFCCCCCVCNKVLEPCEQMAGNSFIQGIVVYFYKVQLQVYKLYMFDHINYRRYGKKELQL